MTASRRQIILAESARLFSERGISATIREIADAVGLNSGTLYHYFNSKDAIVSEILTSFLTELVRHYDTVLTKPETARHRLSSMIRVSLNVAHKHPYATEIYQNEFDNLTELPDYTEIADAVESSHRSWFNVVEEGVQNGEFNSGINIFEFQRMIRECVFQSVRWHRDTLATDIESITETVTSVFLDGFAPVRRKKTDTAPPQQPSNEKREAIPPSGHSPEPAIDQITELRSELDRLRSDMDAIRELLESTSNSHKENGNASTSRPH